MTNEIVQAGHRFFGLHYLILGEDGAHPACDDPALPRDVLRVTTATGRQIDLKGGPADEMRRNLGEAARRRGPAVARGFDVAPPGRPPSPGTRPAPGSRRRRVTE